jgi:L-galactono-1,4-lactone dehydrogenase
VDFALELLALVESEQLAAPSPTEQRWTCGSTSPMSPAALPFTPAAASGDAAAAAEAEAAAAAARFSWVGVIMYLPPGGDAAADAVRTRVAEGFQGFTGAWEAAMWDRYGCQEHWAKIDPAALDPARLDRSRARIRRRFPVEEFNAARARLDPKGVLSNGLIKGLMD